jgi:hypothetical protein
MPDPRVALAVFCEDIREETGGKHSLMGVLSGPVTLHAAPPAQLTRLAVAVWLICDVGDLPGHCVISARLAKAGTDLLRYDLTPDAGAVTPDDSALKQIVHSAAMLPVFGVPADDILEAWIDADGRALRAGRLPLVFSGGGPAA